MVQGTTQISPVTTVRRIQITAHTTTAVTTTAQAIAETVIQRAGHTGAEACATVFTRTHRRTAAVATVKQCERYRY